MGAYAGNGSLQLGGSDVGTDSNDTAYDIGNNSAGIGNSGAFAGYLNSVSGNGDTAYDAGNNSADADGAYAVAGNNNYASDSGNNTALGAYTIAGGGSGNYASVDGPADSTTAAYGDSNIAYVDDPFGAAGSPGSAIAGNGFANDLAEVLFTHGNASAESDNLLYDIVSLFGPSSGMF